MEAGNSHLADINGLASAGITAGCATEPALYCPTVETTRAQMATFLARALGIATTAPPEETTGVFEDTTQSPKDGDFTSVEMSPSHACAVQTDKTLVCWGDNWSGQADPPEGEFVSVALGWAHSCGIRVDQTISCWGGNWDGRAEQPEGEFASISAGDNHVCALRGRWWGCLLGSKRPGTDRCPQRIVLSHLLGGIAYLRSCVSPTMIWSVGVTTSMVRPTRQREISPLSQLANGIRAD